MGQTTLGAPPCRFLPVCAIAASKFAQLCRELCEIYLNRHIRRRGIILCGAYFHWLYNCCPSLKPTSSLNPGFHPNAIACVACVWMETGLDISLHSSQILLRCAGAGLWRSVHYISAACRRNVCAEVKSFQELMRSSLLSRLFLSVCLSVCSDKSKTEWSSWFYIITIRLRVRLHLLPGVSWVFVWEFTLFTLFIYFFLAIMTLQ